MIEREPDPTLQDVMNTLGDLSIHLEGKIHGLEDKLQGVGDELKGEIRGVQKRLDRVEALMVTKDYLDDKLADLKGDMVGLVRREYDKTERLVGILEEDRVISARRATELRSFEVFPRAPQV